MASYDLLRDFRSSADGVVATTPAWVIAVVQFANPITFSRDKLKELKPFDGQAGNVSQEMDPGDNVRAKNILLISSDCAQLATQTSKGTHLSTLSASLLRGEVNYMAEILPGDWIFAWITNSQEEATRVAQKIRNGERANHFNSGLKFMGRVQSVRENTQIERGSGILRTRFNVQAVGFKELDTTIFFEPAFQRKWSDIGTFLGALGLAIGDFITAGKGVDVNLAIPSLFRKLVGEGIPAAFSGTLPGVKVSTGLDAPYAYTMPNEVATMLGKQATAKTSGVAALADIFELLVGLQRYQNVGDDPIDIFTPDGTSIESTHRNTGIPLMGNFVPQTPQFTNKSIWSILNQYLNPAVNEMYTCLRATKYGDDTLIMPTVVVRQLPFSTPAFAMNRNDVTPFHEIPRWKLDSKLVYSYDIGRSNAMRFNFIHVYGQAPMLTANNMSPAAYIRSPPIRDSLDIQRNGLFGDFMDVACDISDQFTGPQKWSRIRGDWQLGMHLTLNGTVQCVGLQAPICEGDNLEFNGVVYHIESISHSCVMDESGRRSFTTVLTITHGLNVNADLTASSIANDTAVYALLSPRDGRDLRAKITYEAKDTVQDPKANDKDAQGTTDLLPLKLDD